MTSNLKQNHIVIQRDGPLLGSMDDIEAQGDAETEAKRHSQPEIQT